MMGMTNGTSMSKKLLFAKIMNQLQQEWETLAQAAKEAHSTATHPESAAENKYDTFGLEAAYLAEGLSRRVAELKQTMQAYSNLPIRDFSGGRIALGAMVELADNDDVILHRFIIGPGGAGISVAESKQTYKVITPSSPLGQQLIGKEEGDEVTLVINATTVTYEIYSIG